MYVIAGASGNTGRVVAETLLAKGKAVRLIVRETSKVLDLVARGAGVFESSLDDVDYLTEALRGAEGAYLLIPPDLTSSQFLSSRARISDRIAEAVRNSGIPHVVLLSSAGSQHQTGTGLIRSTHYAELVIPHASKNITLVRPAYFLDNWAGPAAGARASGELHNYLTPDRKVPMVSTQDIGETAADCLLHPASGKRIVELAGPEDYTPEEISAAVSTVLGKPVSLATHPVESMQEALMARGIPRTVAELFEEMTAGINSGHVAFEGGGTEFRRGRVTTVEAIRKFLIPT